MLFQADDLSSPDGGSLRQVDIKVQGALPLNDSPPAEQLTHNDFQIELFQDFSTQSGARAFPCLDFAAGELPFVGR